MTSYNASLTDEEELEPDDAEEQQEEVDEEEQRRVEDGEVCANCGAEFAKYQGEESLCHPCWDKATPEEREEYVRSDSDTI